MKTLHLLRHAKSSWQAPGVDDHDRDLNDRGRRDAPRMGRALEGQFKPQAIYCSSARRATLTLDGFCEGWPELKAQRHVLDETLYTFDWEVLMGWLQDLKSGAESCFIIGHNPALTELCNQLVGRRALDNLPTAGYLCLSLPIDDWSDVTEGIAELEQWQFPRDLPA